MASISLEGNDIVLYNGLNILTKSPISYPYFKDHFSHTIDFLNGATLTFNYDDKPDQWWILYSHYLNFIDTYKSKLQLSDEQTFLKKEGNSIIVSIVVIIIEHYKWKMSVNTDILKPADWYSDESKNEYIRQYFEHQKTVYDMQLQYLTRNVVERISFKDDKVTEIIKNKMSSKEWAEWVEFVTDAIRMVKGNPNKLEEYKDFLFGIDINIVDYTVQLQRTHIWAYILFNLIFLEQRYALFCCGESIITDNGAVYERSLIDKKTMIELYDHGNSGAIITCSLPFTTFNNFMTDKKWFDTLKKEIQKSYDDLCSEKSSLKENLQKLTEHIEKQMQNFWKVEFYVGTKNRDIGFVKDIVTVNDPKNFYKTDQKLWWSDKEIFDKQWKVKIFEKKRRINDLW